MMGKINNELEVFINKNPAQERANSNPTSSSDS